MNLSTILVNSSAKFRKDILAMPVADLLNGALQHMTLHKGVAGDETVGAVGSGAEVRPYKTEKGASDTSRIIARTLTTYLGDVLEEFDPYVLFTTVYGEQFSDKTNRKEADIVRDLSLAMAKSVSKKLGASLFIASRNPSGTTTAELFNGFGTIAAAEIAAGNIAAINGNYMAVGNITSSNVGDILKSIYDNASEELQEAANLKMFVPKAVKILYDDWYLAHFGAVSYNAAYGRKYLHGTDDHCEIVALSGLKNSPYIYLSTKDNMLVGCDQMDASGREKVLVRVPDNPKVVQFFMCFFWGVQFQMIEQEYLMVAAIGAEVIDVNGDATVAIPAAGGNRSRTYATSNGSGVTASKQSIAPWLTTSVDGNKVTFTAEANESGEDRSVVVRVAAKVGAGYKDVTVSQPAAVQVVITGDEMIDNLPATSGSEKRVYATSDGSNVTAQVTSENSDWLAVSVGTGANKNKVTFTYEAYAHGDGDDPRIATVRIASGDAYLDVTVKQAMATE